METSYSNKPYFFVPLVNKVERFKALNRQHLLSSNYITGKLNVTIKCITPLHFGSGKLEFEERVNEFYHSLLHENNRVALPGSAVKGMIRSVYEAVTSSCVLNSPRELPSKVGILSACDSNDNLCPACSIFGRLSYKGKLSFSSFYSDEEPKIFKIPRLEQPFRTYPRKDIRERDSRTGNERLYYGDFSDIHGLNVALLTKTEFFTKKDNEKQSGGNFYGRKFYKHSINWKALSMYAGSENYECLPIDSLLKGNIIYQGLSEDEFGCLLFALGVGWNPPIYHKLGYAKPAFFGSVKLTTMPEPISRYDNSQKTVESINACALEYYVKHKHIINAAVDALSLEWSQIGDSMWVKKDDLFGY